MQSDTLKAVRQWMEREGGHSSDPEVVAEAVVALCTQLSNRLSPIIGSRGVQSIFARSLKLLRADFPALNVRDLAGSDAWHDGRFAATLRESLRHMDPAAARLCGEGVLVTFTDLLATMVGAGLTWRLLSDVSPARPNEEEA
jgi:hypothetical protein